MTPKQADELRLLIEDYAEAVTEDSWRGAARPEDMPSIECELARARTALDAFIKRLTDGSHD